MAVTHGFLFDHSNSAQNNAPSSGDGGPDYDSPQPSDRLSTRNALGDESAHGDLAGYRAKQAQYGAVQSGGDGSGFALGECDFTTTGQVPADSNLQSTTTAGGPQADHRLVVRDGGADDGTSGPNVGGRVVG